MKKILNHIGVIATLSVVAILFFMMIFVVENDVMTYENTAALQRSKAHCANRGGTWMNNPRGLFDHHINGQGCSIEYKRGEEIRKERGIK